MDDFIIIKSDGYPTYNFAHIVDDIEMGITHIIRGQEFISSTPNYIAVYEALGAPQPIYVTAPPILGAEGTKKLGKRDGAKDTLEYEREGYLPEAMFNFLSFLGWNPGTDQEVMTREEIVAAFDIHKIQKSGAQFNEEKLAWLNKEHMKRLSPALLEEKVKAFLPESFLANMPDAVFQKLLPILLERVSTFGELREIIEAGEFSYLVEPPHIAKETLKTQGFAGN